VTATPLNVVVSAAVRRRSIHGRDVLYPDDPAWEASVTGVRIQAMPRWDAADAYTRTAAAQVPALDRLAVAPRLGDPRSPVYADPVSLSEEATVLEHLVELLGDDRDLAFVVEPGGEDRLLLHFGRPEAR
jgi:hypothetical protein